MAQILTDTSQLLKNAASKAYTALFINQACI